MTPEEYAAAVQGLVDEVIDDFLTSGLVVLAEHNGKSITAAQARSVLAQRDARIREAMLLEAADLLAETITGLDPRHGTDLSYINCTQIDIRALRRMATQQREDADRG
jgi:hypothetical protein